MNNQKSSRSNCKLSSCAMKKGISDIQMWFCSVFLTQIFAFS